MRKIKKPFKIKRREITLILISIMVLVLFFSGYSMGKECSNIRVEANTKVKEGSSTSHILQNVQIKVHSEQLKV